MPIAWRKAEDRNTIGLCDLARNILKTPLAILPFTNLMTFLLNGSLSNVPGSFGVEAEIEGDGDGDGVSSCECRSAL